MTGRKNSLQTSMSFLKFPLSFAFRLDLCAYFWQMNREHEFSGLSVRTLCAFSIPLYCHCKEFGDYMFYMA